MKLAASPAFRSTSPLHFKRNALDAALDNLARINPRQAAMVECRYFGGLDVAEAAALLEVSEATIHRDWRAVRAWLEEQVVRTRS